MADILLASSDVELDPTISGCPLCSQIAQVTYQSEATSFDVRCVSCGKYQISGYLLATLPLADIYQDEAQQYDICDIRGKMCF